MCKENKAIECFGNGFNCSQSIFSVFSEELGVDRETALKISGSFGGGMGRLGEICGAVTGAFMVLGLKYGKYKAEDMVSREQNYALVREFAAKFEAVYGSIKCRDILGVDISTPEGHKEANMKRLFDTKCIECIKTSALILENML